MEQPLVSVITITRNRGNLIGRCIQSVLSQTYRNIEHVVVDGASEDNTDEVIRSFNDDRIHYVKLESNWPIVKTINYGVEISRGQFVTFLDSDDEYKPTKIEKQLEKMLSLPEDYGMVYCWMTYYDQANMRIIKEHMPSLRGNVSKEVVEKPIVSGTPTYFMRRDTFLESGGWIEKERIGIVSDWEFGARLCQKWKVDYVPESLVNVYVNNGTIRMSDSGYYYDLLERTVKFEKYFLTEFDNIFEQYPQKACIHWFYLSKSLMLLGKFADAWPYYRNIMKYRHSFKDFLLLPYCIGKNLFK